MRFVVASFALAALLAPAAGFAQVDSREGIALQNQIYQLRQELRAMQDQVARGGAGGGGGSNIRPAPTYVTPPGQYGAGGNDLVAQLLQRVDALEDQVRQLRGRIDETQNQEQRQNDELNKKIDDLAFQVGQGGGHGSGGSLAAAPQQRPAAPPPAEPPAPRPSAQAGPRTPETALREGNAALARRDYQAAEAAAREVLANRTSPRAYDAQFLLAQALAGEKQYPQAAIAYDDVYNRSRSGTHAQDARLGLANALVAINEKKSACDVLNRMRSEFPQLRSDVSSGMATTAQKAGCR